MRKVHRQMNHVSHPSWIYPHTNYESQTTVLEISELKLLLFYNILAEVQGHKHMMEQNKFPMNETADFIGKILPKIHTENGMVLLFPDHSDIASKVCIYPPSKPWE